MSVYINKPLFSHCLVGVFLVNIVPALILFNEAIFAGQLLATQVNSVVLMTLWFFSVFVYIHRSKFLFIQSIMSLAILVLCINFMLVLVILLVFRLPYSVYYLLMSGSIGAGYCFVSFYWLKTHNTLTLGYIDSERCQQLLSVGWVNWCLVLPALPLSYSRRYDAVVVDFSQTLSASEQSFLAYLSLQGIPVYHVLQVQEYLTGRTKIEHLHENNLGSLLPSLYYLMFKRLVDSLIVFISLPIVLPLALLVAFGVWCDDKKNNAKASVIFTQERIGQGAKPFKMYKFRSMIPSSETQGAKMATANDKRITQFGRFIRKTRLDELPQFINVLKGEMSLIGPRPEQPSFVSQFNESIPFYAYRHIVRPGISGWAQVMHGYASDEDETKVKLEHDFYYIKNFSPTLDLLIVIKTIQTMLTGFGAR